MSPPRKLEWLWLLGKKTWWCPIQCYYHYIALLHTSCRSCKMASKSLYVLLIWLVRSDAKAKTDKEELLFKIWIECFQNSQSFRWEMKPGEIGVKNVIKLWIKTCPDHWHLAGKFWIVTKEFSLFWSCMNYLNFSVLNQ